jgi:hypothetical protein
MRNLFFSLILPFAALVVGGYVARHAFSEGMHTVIASQPGPAKYDDSPRFGVSSACRLDSHLQYQNPLQCRMEGHAAGDENPLVFHAKPVPTMTKAESEKASGWLMLAAFAVPLSLGVAAVLGFLLFRLPSD